MTLATLNKLAMVLSWTVFFSSALAQEPNPAQMMEMMKEYTTPGKEHEFFNAVIGEWDTEMTVMNTPPTKGTATLKWVLDKRFVENTYTGEMMGVPVSRRGSHGIRPLQEEIRQHLGELDGNRGALQRRVAGPKRQVNQLLWHHG